MNKKNNKIDDILLSAKRTLHYNELLIAQSDLWISEEEGNRNMEKQIREKRGNKHYRAKITCSVSKFFCANTAFLYPAQSSTS